jgi:hypothetical protein
MAAWLSADLPRNPGAPNTIFGRAEDRRKEIEIATLEADAQPNR